MNWSREPQISQRTLIYVPVVHTQADMGALSELVRQATLQRQGEKGWNGKTELIDKIWTEIEQAIDDLKLPYERVRLYQDALPVCGREAEIVNDLAKGGSRNHQLLLRLMKKGATIMGTESLGLLMEEYELARKTVAADYSRESTSTNTHNQALSDSLLKRRDQYIADRINGTLAKGEIGILLLGMLHSIENQLDEDIRIIYPVNRGHDWGGENNDPTPC